MWSNSRLKILNKVQRLAKRRTLIKMEMGINWKYIVYCTTNIINNKIYVGVHKTENPDIFDGYIGCGIYVTQPYTYQHAKTNLQYAVKKHGVNNFKRQVLAMFDDAESAYLLESDIVNYNFLERNDVYNMILGGEFQLGESNKIKVYQYDLDGNYLNEYNSFLDASIAINRDYTLISSAVRKKHKASDYFWNTDKTIKLDLSNYNKGLNQRKIIYRYLRNGDFDKQFLSLTDAAKELEMGVSGISTALKLGSLVKKEYYFSEILSNNYSIAKTESIKNRSVHKYSAEGDYICSYDTQRNAELQNQNSNITKSIKLKEIDENGFIWGLEKLNFYNKQTTIVKCNSPKIVGKFKLDGETLVETYESASKAANINGTSVWKVLNGTNNTHKGHIYKYLPN